MAATRDVVTIEMVPGARQRSRGRSDYYAADGALVGKILIAVQIYNQLPIDAELPIVSKYPKYF